VAWAGDDSGRQIGVGMPENNIVPKWLATNVESGKLAQKMGCGKLATYEMLQIGQ